MLRNTNCTFDLISDPERFSLVDVGIRCGVYTNSTRFAQSNNSYILAFAPARHNSYIIHLDGNNTYGWAMSQ